MALDGPLEKSESVALHYSLPLDEEVALSGSGAICVSAVTYGPTMFYRGSLQFAQNMHRTPITEPPSPYLRPRLPISLKMVRPDDFPISELTHMQADYTTCCSLCRL